MADTSMIVDSPSFTLNVLGVSSGKYGTTTIEENTFLYSLLCIPKKQNFYKNFLDFPALAKLSGSDSG